MPADAKKPKELLSTIAIKKLADRAILEKSRNFLLGSVNYHHCLIHLVKFAHCFQSFLAVQRLCMKDWFFLVKLHLFRYFC